MFREMRRKKQELSLENCEKVLERGSSGVLALIGDDDYPYAVPLSYVYTNNKIYFHGAKVGHKIDAVRKCDKASFCVIDRDEVIAKEFTTYFRSVIAFGKVRILEDTEEIRKAIEALAIKYAPQSLPEERHSAIEKEWNGMAMIEFSIEHMTGKEARELM